MREEDEGLDLSEPPTPKKSRRFSAKKKGKPPADVEDPAPAKSPEKKKAPRTPKAKSTPASKPKADVAEVSSVSKRGRQSKKVAYEEIDISPVEQEEEEEIVEEEIPPLIPKKAKGKNNNKVKNSKKGESEKKPEIPAELPPAPLRDRVAPHMAISCVRSAGERLHSMHRCAWNSLPACAHKRQQP